MGLAEKEKKEEKNTQMSLSYGAVHVPRRVGIWDRASDV